MNLEQLVLQKLYTFFEQSEDQIEVLDERGDGHHFIVKVTSEKFADLSRIKRSQMVYQLLDEFLKNDTIHALRLRLKTPNELNNG